MCGVPIGSLLPSRCATKIDGSSSPATCFRSDLAQSASLETHAMPFSSIQAREAMQKASSWEVETKAKFLASEAYGL